MRAILVSAAFTLAMIGDGPARAEYVKPDHAPALCLDFTGGKGSIRRCVANRASQEISLPGANASQFRVAGHCIEASRPGEQLMARPCRDFDLQKWTYDRRSGALRNTRTGLCADVAQGSTQPGASVIAYRCTREPNQRWNTGPIFVATPRGTTLRPLYAQDRCVDLADGGSKLILWTCHGQDNQRFVLPNDANAKIITNGDKCLGATDAGSISFGPRNCLIQQITKFWIADGTGTIRTKSGLCLTVPGSSTKTGTRLTLEPCQQGAPNQVFRRQ